MSYRGELGFKLPRFVEDFKGQNLANKTEEQLLDMFHKIMKDGIHGICYSAYAEGQQPGDILEIDQIRRRIGILAPYVKAVRSFSCVEGNELIPVVAKEFGLETMVGAWLGNDQEKNKIEVDALIKLANEGKVDIAAVGNEVLYRNDLEKWQVMDWIHYVRANIPKGIPVAYVDAYYEFYRHPDLVAVCDLILSNYYPFWEGVHINDALANIHRMQGTCIEASQNKNIIVTETGWPSAGESLDGAQPSRLNALRYFVEIQLWAQQNRVDLYYFSSFDEDWKVGPEGDVGAYWGLWDKNEQLKY